MTTDELRTELQAATDAVQGIPAGASPAPLVDRLWKLRRQAAQISGVAPKVPRLVARAADTLEMLRDVPEATKLLRTALAGLTAKRSAPRPAA